MLMNNTSTRSRLSSMFLTLQAHSSFASREIGHTRMTPTTRNETAPAAKWMLWIGVDCSKVRGHTTPPSVGAMCDGGHHTFRIAGVCRSIGVDLLNDNRMNTVLCMSLWCACGIEYRILLKDGIKMPIKFQNKVPECMIVSCADEWCDSMKFANWVMRLALAKMFMTSKCILSPIRCGKL